MKSISIILIFLFALSMGCNVSPLSPSNRQRINNNGEIGDIRNNQNGIMAEILSIKNRLDIIARDVENIQNGFINSNNKNFGVQIFQGEGGLVVGLSAIIILSLIAVNYKLKSEAYKKTAEIFGEEIKNMRNIDLENHIFTAALANKVEKPVYNILKKSI
jgi:tetrahydromethanopterin S-methyltransferase subunit G